MATYTLSNRFVSFAFVTDATYGLKLIAMLKLGQNHTWGNNDGRLWQAKLWDSLNPLAASTTLNPDLAHLTALTATKSTFAATWTALPALGADTLNVLFTATIDDEEDFLRVRLEASWTAGASRCAIDTIGPIPLAMAPFNQGSDAACMSMQNGILSRDPIEHLRYAAAPGTQFFTLQRNEWFFPSGHGWSMPLWGYYETVAHQGWMLWLEEISGAPISIRFESDGTDMVWEANEPQEDHVVVANGGREVGSDYCFCLRPLVIRTVHGWSEIAAFYRARYEATRPLGYVPQRVDRTDLSELERQPAVFIDVSPTGATHSLGDGKPGDVQGLIRKLRQGAGIPADVPIWGTLTASTYNLNFPGEVANGDLAAKVALLPADRVFLGAWYPGAIGPELWDLYQWLTAAHVASDRRWHTTHDIIHIARESRGGYLAGDNDDTLLQDVSRYYRERTYTVVSYNAGTFTVTVSGGTPNADGFSGGMFAILVRGTTVRLAQAVVSALGATTVTLTGLPTDVLGTTRTPVAGDQLVVRHDFMVSIYPCFHAAVRSSSYIAALSENLVAGMERNAHICGRYFDAWTSLWNRQINDGLNSRRLPHCYRDHLNWTVADPGFKPHPKGGGAWNQQGFREFAAYVRNVARESQRSNARQVFFFLHTEFTDQTTLDLFDVTWSPIGMMNAWRNTAGFDPSTHLYLCVPMYSMVHAGRHHERALNQEVSSALADPSVNFASLREFLAYCLSDWPYGMTAPAFSFFQSDTIPLYDLFDERIYQGSGGTVNRDVRRVRDLWVQVMRAELFQAGAYMHQGAMQTPATLDYSVTSTTTGLAQTPFANDYHTGDVLYDRATFPRVTHGVWKGRDGTFMVVFVNWTFQDAAWAGTLDIEGMGLAPLGSGRLRGTQVKRSDGLGQKSKDVSFDHATGKLVLGNVPALSVALVTMRPAANHPVAVKVYRPRWMRGTG